MIKNKRYCTFQNSYREIFLKSALALSAPKTGCHHTSMSFSGPSKNPTLSISRIHATDSIRHTRLRISENMKIKGESALKASSHTCYMRREDPGPGTGFLVRSQASQTFLSATGQCSDWVGFVSLIPRYCTNVLTVVIINCLSPA